jgi:CelD/BcsL family acetyltransferase involved in cellulose biosynthesis
MNETASSSSSSVATINEFLPAPPDPNRFQGVFMGTTGRDAPGDINKILVWPGATCEENVATSPSARLFPNSRKPRTPMSLSPDIADAGVTIARRGDGVPLQVTKFTSWQEWDALSPDCERILQGNPELTIFSTPEWLGAWWKAFGQARQLIALSISNAGGEVIGLAPLYLESVKKRQLNGVRRLRLVGDGTGDSDNLDLIFRSGHEVACSEALLARLGSEAGWDVCELNTLCANSSTARAMLDCLKKRGWPARQWTRDSSVVPLPDNWDTYLSQLSREQARGIERYTRRLERHHDVRIFKCATEEELQPALEVLIDLHQKRWQSQGQPGSFAESERRHFYHEMSRGFLRRGWLEFWMMELDGKPAACQFAFRYGDTVYQLQEGLDPKHYSDRAGIVLRAHILKQLIAQGVRQYDFLGGINAHKQSWGAQPGSYLDICFAKPSSRGYIHLFLRHKARIADEWLRLHLPAPVLRVLRQMSSRVSEQA